jgi:hypothetical protein
LIFELLVQPNLRPQAMRHTPLNALAVLAERGQYAVGFLLDNLYLANAGQINPVTVGDLIRQRLEVTFDGFPDERFGEITSLSSDICNTLSVVHNDSPDLSVSN